MWRLAVRARERTEDSNTTLIIDGSAHVRIHVSTAASRAFPRVNENRTSRIAIDARLGNEDLTFLLDSGATHVVLFRIPQAMAASQPIASTINTLDGARRSVPTCWTSRMSLTDSISFKNLPAAIVLRSDMPADGLLPVSLFKTVFVDHARGKLVLVR